MRVKKIMHKENEGILQVATLADYSSGRKIDGA
jgi:hypothetical protein